MNDLLVQNLLKLAEDKPAGTETKRDPAKWEAAKRKAKAKMGGKHSARAMQLATKYYKDSGGKYKGKKPTAKNNKLKKWTKQDWQWSGERDKKSSVIDSIVEKLAGKGVYLPAKSIDALKSSKKGRDKLRAASRKKTVATNKGEQVARHGLHVGKKRSKLGAADPNYRDRVALWLHDGKGNLLVQDDRSKGLGFKFPAGGIEPGQTVNDAAIMEALEEVGYRLKGSPSVIPGVGPRKVNWDPIFLAEAAKKGRIFKGSRHFHRLAEVGERDESLLGSQGDALRADWIPIEEVLRGSYAAADDPNNKYNYFDRERLRAAEKVMELLSNKTASYHDPLLRAYHLGCKLATADFGDNSASDDMTLSYDYEVDQKVNPRDFVSNENWGNMTPRTNSNTWIGESDEVVRDQTENTNYKRDYTERT